jgi:predicted anti-sigma-YlaC factor YlaD
MTPSFSRRLLALTLLAILLPACSVKKMAVDKLGDALASGGSTYASDDDPVLVGDAIPFGLKTMESLLAESPRHKGLLLAACSGFAQYAYGWVQLPADYVEDESLARATRMRKRARKLYLRARDYGLRGLEVDFPGVEAKLRTDPVAALTKTKKEHVPLLYWTAAAWAGAIALKINDAELSADQSVVDALARRALLLDPSWDLGSIHDFFIAWEAGRSSIGGSMEKAREHFEKAVAVSGGRRAFPYVSYAESIAVPEQDKAAFKQMLEKALAVDTSKPSDYRLANVLAQTRARWLQGQVDELFIE